MNVIYPLSGWMVGNSETKLSDVPANYAETLKVCFNGFEYVWSRKANGTTILQICFGHSRRYYGYSDWSQSKIAN
jgi:hypothetical protein